MLNTGYAPYHARCATGYRPIISRPRSLAVDARDHDHCRGRSRHNPCRNCRSLDVCLYRPHDGHGDRGDHGLGHGPDARDGPRIHPLRIVSLKFTRKNETCSYL